MKTPWWSRRAIGLHVTLAVCFPGFLVLGWWQLHRALAGNGLSWAYTVEWPIFAVYAVFVWWKLVHEPPGTEVRARRRLWPGRHRQSADDEARAAADLASYNAYLASLRARSEHRRR